MELPATNEFTPSVDKPAKWGRNFVWMTWSAIISIANSVLVWVFMARLRDVDEVGRFTIAMGLYALFFSIVSLGLMPYLIHEISRRANEERKPPGSVNEFVSSASVFLLISGILSAIVMTVGGFLISGSWAVRISVFVLSLAMIPTGLLTVAEATALSYGRVRLMAVVTTIENLLRTIAPIGLILGGFDIVAICVSFAAVRFIALFFYVAVAYEQTARFAFSSAQFRRIASICPTFAGTIVFASINWQLALILLGYLGTEAESAKYGAAVRFLIPVSILMASYGSVIQPVIARQQTLQDLGLYLSKMARYPLIASVLIAGASPFLSRQVLASLFGESYVSASPTLEVLALSTIPFCLVMVVARGLVATKSQHVDLFANILGVFVCFCTGAALIPRYGAVGAATAQFLSFLSMALVEVTYLSRKTGGFRVGLAAPAAGFRG